MPQQKTHNGSSSCAIETALIDYPFSRLVSDDLARVETLLRDHPAGQHEAVSRAMDRLLGGGGKRIRPTLILLSAHLCGANISQAVIAGAAAEMLHIATLVHDDLIDGSLMRRGVETLQVNWTPAATVLTGDYLFARSAHLVTETGCIGLVERFAETLVVICNGEIRQMFDGNSSQTTVERYRQRIQAKTARLIALSAQAGAILVGGHDEWETALHSYGEGVGTAFQIVDDVLDFVADEETLGKPVGSDLRQGLVTLPVLLFLESEHDQDTVRQVLEGDRSEETVKRAVQAVAESKAVDEALAVARHHAEEARAALNSFPDTRYRAALLDLADFAIGRRF